MISITVLQARQIDNAVELHKVAFAGNLNTQIGNAYTRAFIRWFQEAEEGIALCALDDRGDVVGYVVGAPIGYTASLTSKTLLPAVLGISMRPWLFMNSNFRRIVSGLLCRLLPFSRDTQMSEEPILTEPVYSLVGVAVSPLVRGQGIGQKLVDAFERQVADRGGRSCRLSVYPQNFAARKLYERAGWQLHQLTHNPIKPLYYYKIIS